MKRPGVVPVPGAMGAAGGYPPALAWPLFGEGRRGRVVLNAAWGFIYATPPAILDARDNARINGARRVTRRASAARFMCARYHLHCKSARGDGPAAGGYDGRARGRAVLRGIQPLEEAVISS
jgi:hypothetical protein